MKSLLFCTLLFGSLTVTSSLAKVLTHLDKKGWASYHAGFAGSGFEIGVDTGGQVEFYFTPKKKERANANWPLESQIRIERREKGEEKWVKKKTILDGFTTEETVEFGQKDLKFEATVTGDVKFKVKITFDRHGANIESEMVGEPKDADKAEYRLILESSMPSLMLTSSKYDEKELKSKTRGDEVRIKFKKSKEQKIRLFEKQDAKKITATLPTSITLKADKIGRKKFTWRMLDHKDKGAFELGFKSVSNRFLNGFNIRVILVDEKGDRLSKGIRLEYR